MTDDQRMTHTVARRHGRATRTSAPAVALRGLTKRFGAVTAVDGIDLTVEPGEVVAFLGPNGAGKTSTIDMVLGLSQPDAGRRSRSTASRRAAAVAHGLVSAVMQTGGLLKDLTVARDRRAHRQPVRAQPAGRRGARAGRHRRDRRPPGRQVLRRRAAAAAVRHGAAARPRAAHPRRADHRHGRRGPPGLLGAPSAPTPSGAAPSCSPRTTSRRPTPTPTGSCWSARAGSSPTAPPRRSRRWPPAGRHGPPGRAPRRAARCAPSRASTASRCAATPC